MKRLTIVIIIMVLTLTLAGCKDSPETDDPNNSIDDTQFDMVVEALDVFDGSLYQGTPLPQTQGGVSIAYEIIDETVATIMDNTIVLLEPELGPKDIEVNLILTKDDIQKRYTKILRVMPNYSINAFTEETVPFFNVSQHIDVPPSSETIYTFNNGIPYMTIDAFLRLISQATHAGSLTKTLEDNRLAYTIFMGRTYSLEYDFETTNLTFNHSDFFNAIGVYQPVFSMIQECGDLCRVSYQSADVTSSREVSFNLGYYGMQFIREDDTIYAPLALLNELFSGPYYDVAYTGTRLVGYDILMLQDEAFLDAVYPDDPLSAMSESYKAQTYHYFALVLDMFYGLDSYFDIDDFYTILDPFKSALLADDIDGHYDGIVDIILAFDERHTGIRYHGFYKDDQVIDRTTFELGPRVSDLRDSEIWLRDNYCDNDNLIDVSEDGTLARVRFNQFMETDYLAFIDAVNTLDTHPYLESVIIDVSCNSGGLLSILLSATGLLTDDAFTFSYINTLHQEQSTYSITSPLDQLPYELYIQTSEFSYSAAHIFTTYMDDYDLATIIGQPTGGGAAAIRDIVLPNGSHIVISSPLVFVDQDDTIIEFSHQPDILIPYEDFIDIEIIKSYLE